MLFFSCEKPEDNDEAKKPTVAEDCVPVSEITSTKDSFYTFYPGNQKFGKTKGVKINKEFEASVYSYNIKTGFAGMFVFTLWNPDFQFSLGDIIYIDGWEDTKDSKGCYDLTPNEASEDSLKCTYTLFDYDIALADYVLDLDSINKMEIIEYSPDSLKVKAKMSAHFVTDDYWEPFIPERVSFLNVEIEAHEAK